jgi:hypothetical protein
MPKTAPQYLVRHYPFLQSHDVHATYRYCPEAEQLRQEQEEIQLRRRVREAVNAELAALAVPTAASRNGSFEQSINSPVLKVVGCHCVASVLKKPGIKQD